MQQNLPPQVINRIEQLVDASYSGRDELYAAARKLEDAKRRHVCEQLAEHLADHAIELQQLLAANGENVAEPLDLYAVAEAFFQLAKHRQGEAGVLHAAERCERTVKERFDEAIEATEHDDTDTAALLQRQRNEIAFGEDVLRTMQDPPNEDA